MKPPNPTQPNPSDEILIDIDEYMKAEWEESWRGSYATYEEFIEHVKAVVFEKKQGEN